MSANIFLKRILLIVCLDWALWRHCLSGELQSACFTVCCWSACLLAFVDVSQNSIDVCWGSSDVFLFCLSAPLSGSFKEGPAGVCLDWVRVSSISFWWTHQVLLEVSPTVCLSVSPSGILGFLLGGLVGAFDVCCSVFLDSPIHRDWGLFCLSLFSVSDEVGVYSSSVSVRCQLGVFSVSPNILSKPIRSSSDLSSH